MRALRNALAAFAKATSHDERRAAIAELARVLNKSGRELTGWQADGPCG